jgi:amylosucrase
MKNKQLISVLFDMLFPNHEEAKASLLEYVELNMISESQQPWFSNTPIVAMTLYVDLFSKNIISLKEKLHYFQSLGVNLIHLMPILKTRKEENDGGYAVVDFNDIDPKFGTKEDLLEVIQFFHEHGIRIMIDFVLNHVAKEHLWAIKALQEDIFYQNFFMMYDDAFIPTQFDLTVPLVIPERKKTNFTYLNDLNKYIYTSFSDYQWDLNYKNPYVLIEMLKQLHQFSKWGIDMLRLDAIPFMWKTLGTTCRNLPEVHVLMRIFRAFRDLTCPQLALLGEAIVEPHEIVKYFGTDDAPECDFMYNANLMVNLWNTIATQDTRLLKVDANRFELPKHGAWLNYIRCHDDIGWGFNEDALYRYGFDPFLHKQFLISFFNGSFKGSFSKGIDYQKNEKTKDARTNGMLASLIGIEDAKDQQAEMLLDLSIKRMRMLNAILFFYQGAPMIYAGDDIGMTNDLSYLEDVHKKDDSRWIHRPFYDWNLYSNLINSQKGTAQIYHDLKQFIQLRKTQDLLHPFVQQTALDIQHQEIILLEKKQNKKRLYGLFNVTSHTVIIDMNMIRNLNLVKIEHDLIQNRMISLDQPTLTLAPYEILFIPGKTA